MLNVQILLIAECVCLVVRLRELVSAQRTIR